MNRKLFIHIPLASSGGFLGAAAVLGFALAAFSVVAHSGGLASAAEADWPQFRGPTGDGVAPAGLPLAWSESEHVTWKTAIPGRGWSSPVIGGEKIWFTTATPDGKSMSVICVDKKSGALLQNKELFTNEKVFAIHTLNSYASPTPVLEEDRVYVSFGSYGLACLNANTCESIWTRRDLPCEHFRGPGSSPILFENLLILHYDGFDFQYVVALDKLTGKTVWKQDRQVDYGTKDGDIMKAFSTPSIFQVDGRLELISTTSKAVLSYDPRTGKEYWRVRYSGFSATARPLFGHGMFFINTGFSKADVLGVKTGGSGDITASHVAWTVKKGIGSKPSPILAGDHLYVLHDSGVATCLAAATGEEVWSQRVGSDSSASPIISGDRIYFCDQAGAVSVVRASPKFELLSKNQLDDGCMASPAASGKTLFLRTKTHIYRIEE